MLNIFKQESKWIRPKEILETIGIMCSSLNENEVP